MGIGRLILFHFVELRVNALIVGVRFAYPVLIVDRKVAPGLNVFIVYQRTDRDCVCLCFLIRQDPSHLKIRKDNKGPSKLAIHGVGREGSSKVLQVVENSLGFQLRELFDLVCNIMKLKKRKRQDLLSDLLSSGRVAGG